jgi:hypothetical protein
VQPDRPPVRNPVRHVRNNLIPVVVLASTLMVAVLWVVGPYVFAGRDDPNSIDSRPVHDRALVACREMRASLAAQPASAEPTARAEAENQAVEAMVARIRDLGPAVLARDAPTETWLADWDRLVAARRQAMAARSAFSIPEAEGSPVNLRMFDLVKGDLRPCDVPDELLAARPGAPG